MREFQEPKVPSSRGRELRDPARAAAAGFLVGVAFVTATLVAASALGSVRGAAALLSPLVPVALLGFPVVALVRDGLNARRERMRADGASSSPNALAFATGLALPGATLLFCLPLFEAWVGGRSNGTYMGGVVPVSDASAYFGGAERLLLEGTLDAWNSRRPLNAALLAARTLLAGGDFRGALFVQAALLGTTTALAARALAADYGRDAALLLFGGLYVFGAIFVATTMSESLGLSLGALSLALLWHGMRAPRPWLLAAGFAVCAMALNARSGAFLMLPCLVLWAALARREGRLVNLMSATAALGGVAAGFATNALVSIVYRGAAGGTHSNFSYTVYGLALGGKGWERAMSDFPELRGMGDAEAGAFVYARAMAEIREHPLQLVIGLMRGAECFVLSMSEKLSLGLLDGHTAASWAFAVIWCGVAVVVTRRALRLHNGDRGFLMVSFAAFGALGSVPVIYVDGRERVFAASVPFVLAGAAIALASLRPRAPTVAAATAERHARLGRLPAFVAAVVVATAVLGPGFRPKASFAGPSPAGASGCAGGLVPVRVHVRRGLPQIDLLTEERALARPFAAALTANVFHAGIARDVNLGTNPYADALRGIAEHESLLSAFDLDTKRVRHLVLPAGALAGRTGTARVCVDLGPHGDAAVVRATVDPTGD